MGSKAGAWGGPMFGYHGNRRDRCNGATSIIVKERTAEKSARDRSVGIRKRASLGSLQKGSENDAWFLLFMRLTQGRNPEKENMGKPNRLEKEHDHPGSLPPVSFCEMYLERESHVFFPFFKIPGAWARSEVFSCLLLDRAAVGGIKYGPSGKWVEVDRSVLRWRSCRCSWMASLEGAGGMMMLFRGI